MKNLLFADILGGKPSTYLLYNYSFFVTDFHVSSFDHVLLNLLCFTQLRHGPESYIVNRVMERGSHSFLPGRIKC